MTSNDTEGRSPSVERGPEPGADGGDHMPDPFLDHPDAAQPFGGGSLPDSVTEPEPGVYVFEMPDPGPEAEPF
jgi:hypothetical protein